MLRSMEGYRSQVRLKYISRMLNIFKDVSSRTEGAGLLQFANVPVCIMVVGTQ